MSSLDEPADVVQEEEPLPRSSAVSFLHAVGQSTLRQGMAVPVIAQIGWLAKIDKGQAVPVTIMFGDGESVPATLRRINNARGHLQLRYEAKNQTALRDYLVRVFGSTTDFTNGLLRISELQPGVFRFDPVSTGRQAVAALSLSNPHFHNCKKLEIYEYCEFRELEQCLKGISYNEQHNQAQYNKEIALTLSRMGWKCETRILDQIGLRCDFEKNGVWLEVEFGNARVYYQNYIKFLVHPDFARAVWCSINSTSSD